MITTLEATEIEALTEKINSDWEKEEKQTPISKEMLKALETVGIYRFESEEEMAEYEKWEDDNSELKNRLKRINDY